MELVCGCRVVEFFGTFQGSCTFQDLVPGRETLTVLTMDSHLLLHSP